MKVNSKKMSETETSWSGRLVDFPGNMTVYNVRLSLQDKQGNIVNVTSGVYLFGAIVLQTTIENLPLEECPGALRGQPVGMGIFPHRLVDAIPNVGASLFTAADGSQPQAGVWSKNLAEMVLAVGGVSLDPDKAIPTIVRLDIDYREGKPEVRTLRKELSLGDMCGKAVMEKLTRGGRTWIAKSKPIEYDLPDADIYSIRGTIEEGGTEMKVKINGKEVCTSKAEYVNIPPNPRKLEGIPTPGSGIVKMTECITPWKILRGDKIELETYYDFDKHPISASLENYIIANKKFPLGMGEGIYFTITKRPRFEGLANVPEWIADITGI